jgi:TolB-like protein/tetratricopeptide (TPR) repeat protein
MVPELDKTAKVELPPGVSQQAVRAALDKVAASSAFGTAERPARFLRHLVEAALRGDLYLLKESVLGVDVFERPADWDPREIPVVRQEAARLRKRLARYYETDGAGDKVRIELPVGTYVPVFQRVGEIPVPREPAPAPARAWWPSAAFAMVLLSATAVAWRVTNPPAPVSIAVLPFTNLSGDPADQYFVDGLSDGVTDSLARLKPLRVIARSSANVFRKQPRDLGEIARRLRVSHILEATVERSGDRVAIVASLIRTSDRARIWTNTYRRSTADLAGVQTDLTDGVRSSLGIAGPAAQPPHVPSEEARRVYWKTRFVGSQFTLEANRQAQAGYRRCIEIDPNYAAAYAGLASAIWNLNIQAGVPPVIEDRRKAQELWQKAVEIDPMLASAHSGLAMYAMQYDWDWARAERELKAVLAVGGNAGAENDYATLCLILGRRAEAEQHRQRSHDLDPASPALLMNDADYLNLAGRFAESREEWQQVLTRTKAVRFQLALYDVMASQGQVAEALKGVEGLPQDQPDVQLGLAGAKAAAGARNEARAILAALERHYVEDRLFTSDFAAVYASMGDEANTVKWMERAMDAREGPAMYIRVNPVFAKMQSRPAFRALKKRMNLDW